MKKSILFILLSTILVLTSCGKTDTPIINNSDTSKEEQNIGEKTSNPSLAEKEEQKVENSGDTVEKLQTTMLEIFKSGKTATCTFKITNEGVTFDGITYIDGTNISYTMSGDVEGKKMINHSIMKDGYSYSWSNMSKDGFKIKEDLSEDENSGNEEAPMEAEEMNQKVDFECKKGVDSSKFELPTDINFQEFNVPEIPTGN